MVGICEQDQRDRVTREKRKKEKEEMNFIYNFLRELRVFAPPREIFSPCSSVNSVSPCEILIKNRYLLKILFFN